MGAADVVPGVSGGTMAFILGIYREFIDAIKSFDMAWISACLRFDADTALRRPHFAFVIPLLAGIVAALLFFTRVVELPALLSSHPEHVYALFFGLISASIAVLMAQLGRLRVSDGVSLIAGLVFGFAVVTAVPTETPHTWWFITMCGAISICAMVVPGISGSFVLLLLGQYAYILDALGHFEWRVIVPFACGAAIGLMSFTRLLSWALRRYERTMVLAINGVLIASLWVVWPFQHREFVLVRGKQRLIETTPELPSVSGTLLEPALLALAGFFAVLVLEKLAARSHERHRQ